MLVRLEGVSAERSTAETRARSERITAARRACPSGERSESFERNATLAPLSMPSEVALSGDRARRLAATESRSAVAWRSSMRGPEDADATTVGVRMVQAVRAVVEAAATKAWRRVREVMPPA